MKIVRQFPVGLALSLSEVKAYLKITHSNEDRLLTHLIKTAEDLVGERHGHYALTRQLEMTVPLVYPKPQGLRRYIHRLYYHYPFASLALAPIQSIDRVIIQRDDGEQKQLDPHRWKVLETHWPTRVMIKVLEGHSTEIRLTVGYGAEGDTIPPTLRHQILSLVQRLYKNRGSLEEQANPFPRRLSL